MRRHATPCLLLAFLLACTGSPDDTSDTADSGDTSDTTDTGSDTSDPTCTSGDGLPLPDFVSDLTSTASCDDRMVDGCPMGAATSYFAGRFVFGDEGAVCGFEYWHWIPNATLAGQSADWEPGTPCTLTWAIQATTDTDCTDCLYRITGSASFREDLSDCAEALIDAEGNDQSGLSYTVRETGGGGAVDIRFPSGNVFASGTTSSTGLDWTSVPSCRLVGATDCPDDDTGDTDGSTDTDDTDDTGDPGVEPDLDFADLAYTANDGANWDFMVQPPAQEPFPGFYISPEGALATVAYGTVAVDDDTSAAIAVDGDTGSLVSGFAVTPTAGSVTFHAWMHDEAATASARLGLRLYDGSGVMDTRVADTPVASVGAGPVAFKESTFTTDVTGATQVRPFLQVQGTTIYGIYTDAWAVSQPTTFTLDGVDDPSVEIANRPSATRDIRAALANDGVLYVSTPPTEQGGDRDLLLVVVVGGASGGTLDLPWLKAGTVPRGVVDTLLLVQEENASSNGYCAWYVDDGAGGFTHLTDGVACHPATLHTARLEGTVDLPAVLDLDHATGIPGTFGFAAAMWGTEDHDTLLPQTQVPEGDGDGNIDASELATIHRTRILTRLTPYNPDAGR